MNRPDRVHEEESCHFAFIAANIPHHFKNSEVTLSDPDVVCRESRRATTIRAF